MTAACKHDVRSSHRACHVRRPGFDPDSHTATFQKCRGLPQARPAAKIRHPATDRFEHSLGRPVVFRRPKGNDVKFVLVAHA